jgi:hypothetical protein
LHTNQLFEHPKSRFDKNCKQKETPNRGCADLRKTGWHDQVKHQAVISTSHGRRLHLNHSNLPAKSQSSLAQLFFGTTVAVKLLLRDKHPTDQLCKFSLADDRCQPISQLVGTSAALFGP